MQATFVNAFISGLECVVCIEIWMHHLEYKCLYCIIQFGQSIACRKRGPSNMAANKRGVLDKFVPCKGYY